MPPRRENTLHLLSLSPGEVRHVRLATDQVTYYGEHVAEVAAQAGLSVRPLRRLAYRFLGEEDGVRRSETVWQVEWLAGAVGDVPGDPAPESAVPEDAAPESLGEWLDTARHSPGNPPWTQPGWFAGALAWADRELHAQGWLRHGEPRVLKHWQISALWRLDTTHGPVYFKAVPGFFRREVEVTPWLARELPGAAPRVLAADLERGVLLLEDAGGPVDEAELDLPGLLRHVARVQRQSVALLPEWAARGLTLRDRGPEYVLGWLDRLLTDGTLMVGQPQGFTPEQAQALRSRRPALEAALHRLAGSPLPRTLGHGDLHGGNVAYRDGQFTLLDWSDVCVTHPFLDANPAYFLPDPWDTGPPADPAPLEAARSAYLDAWSDLAPADELRALAADGEQAGELYRALGYVDGIQDAVGDKTEWAGAHLGHLRHLLSPQEALDG